MKLAFYQRLVPTPRLLLALGLVAPFALLATVMSAAIAQIMFAAVVTIAVIDAFSRYSKKAVVEVLLPPVVRLSKDRPSVLRVRIYNADQKTKMIRLGLPFPTGVNSENADRDVTLPQHTEYSWIDWPCEGTVRGSFRMDHCFIEQRSLLGLWNVRSGHVVDCEFRVYPNLLEERKKLAARFLKRDEYGAHLRKMVGQGREFEKLREYVPGDGYDQLHWKATAKRGRPITKVFQIEKTQEVYVVVDYSRLSAKQFGSETALEFFLRSALILGTIAQQNGDLFGVITLSDRVQGFIRAGNGKAHYHACRDLLYRLQPGRVTPDYEDLFSFIRLRLRRRALLIVLTDLNDPMLAESFLRSARLITRHHLLLVNMVRPEGGSPLFSRPDADSIDSVYERLSGHLVWENLSDLQNELHRFGISLSLLDLPTMSVDVVNQYFRVKERQLL